MVLLTAAFGVAFVAAQTEGGSSNVAIILDASGSMQAALGGSTRIDVAREAVISTAEQLPATTNASLWAYGHRLSQDDPAASCQDIEQVIPLSAVEIDGFSGTVRNLDAIGYTPISDTLQQVAASFPADGSPRSIVLISDGEETCAGDPCAVARDLKLNNVDLVVNTVGFAADAATREQLQCIAQVTGGVYYDAQDADQLAASLEAAAVVPDGAVRIVDPQGNPLPDVAFSLSNAETGESLGSFLGGGSVPAGAYNAEIRLQELTVQPVTVIADETTDIVVNPIIGGQVQLVDADGMPLEELRFSLTDAQGAYVGAYLGSGQVPVGEYSVSVATIIPFETTATVVEGEVTEIVVNTETGTIRLVDAATEAVLEEPLFEVSIPDGAYLGAHAGTFDVPPGEYNVRVRSTVRLETTVTVEAGAVVDIPLSTETGTIRLVDEATGAVLEEPLFEVSTADGAYLGAQSGTFDVPPGDYTVRVRWIIPFDTQITVVPGASADVVLNTAVGTLQLVDGSGALVTDIGFEVTSVDAGAYLGTQFEPFQAPPGTYTVLVRGNDTVERFDIAVTVAEGTVTEINVDAQTTNNPG